MYKEKNYIEYNEHGVEAGSDYRNRRLGDLHTQYGGCKAHGYNTYREANFSPPHLTRDIKGKNNQLPIRDYIHKEGVEVEMRSEINQIHLGEPILQYQEEDCMRTWKWNRERPVIKT